MVQVLAQVVTIDIATPNSNGLSNNQVDDFDVNTDGTILNNSASGGTAQLGTTTVTANPNITAGSIRFVLRSRCPLPNSILLIKPQLTGNWIRYNQLQYKILL